MKILIHSDDFVTLYTGMTADAVRDLPPEILGRISDRDLDRIDDAMEDLLLKQFAPYDDFAHVYR